MTFGDPIHDVLALWVGIIKVKMHFPSWLFVRIHLFSWGKIHIHYIIHLKNVVGRIKFCGTDAWLHAECMQWKPTHNPWTQHMKESECETIFLCCINMIVWMFHLAMQTQIQNKLCLFCPQAPLLGKRKNPWSWRKPVWKQDPCVLWKESLPPEPWISVCKLQHDAWIPTCCFVKGSDKIWILVHTGFPAGSGFQRAQDSQQDLDFSAHWKVGRCRGGPGNASPAVASLSMAHHEQRQPHCPRKQSTGFSLAWFLNRHSKV